MSKRGNDCSLEFIAKKLRKLEKAVKRSRREKRNCFQLSSSSSSSSQSRSSSSRESSPNRPEDENSQEPTENPSPSVQNDSAPPVQLGEEPVVTNTAEPTDASTVPADANEENNDILDILGVDPSVTIEYGPDLNKDVATRLTHIATAGLNKDNRKDLIKKHLIPGNCANIAAPQLNAEIKAALTEPVLKRDRAIENRQKQIAAGISSLGRIISDQLNAKEKNSDLIRDLMDVCRIFCDIQYSESEARRNFALYSVKKDLKDQLSTTKIDKYLFGSDLTETLKAAKAVSKSSSDLKPDPPKNTKPPTPSTSTKNLNWKAWTPARRQPPGPAPRHQQPAAPSASPRGNSSQTYTQRSKQTRRR